MNLKNELKNKTTRFTARIHGMSHSGEGIATIENKTTFVPGGLIDESVSCQLIKINRSYNEAKILDILETSKERATPPCEHFGTCGGCSLQHMQMAAQVELKQKTLIDQLKHFGRVEPDQILLPLTSKTLGYRRKARIGVKYVFKKDKLLIGFREKKSRYLADIKECAILHPKVGKHLYLLSELISSLDGMHEIPQIEVAMGDNNAALVFRHLKPLSPKDLEKLTMFGKKEQFDIYLQPTSPLPFTKLFPEDTLPQLSYRLPSHQIEFLFHPLDFTQIHLELNELMVNQAVQLLNLSSDDCVLDLFCGIGNFALPLARRVRQVNGIEGSHEMVKRAFANAKHNQIQNAAFYTSDLTTSSDHLPWAKMKYDKILLDPPRIGAKEILPLINNLSPQKICYISCNPATLARDAGELVHRYKYHLSSVGVMNMFPHTAHTEAMAIFDKHNLR